MRIQAHIQLKNYEMLERRKALGYTFKQFEISCGVDYQRLSRIENLQAKPTEEEAIEIASVLGCEPRILFPDGYSNLVNHLKKVDFKKVADFTPNQLDTDRHLLLLNAQITIDKALGILNPKERRVIEMRHGLGEFGGQPHNLDEVGREFGVTRERVRQIEAKAHEKLRNSKYFIDKLTI